MSSDSETATDPLHPLAFTVGSFVMMIAAGVLDVLDGPVARPHGDGRHARRSSSINVVYEKVITPRWDLGQTLRAQVSTIAHESFEGGTVVKALGAEDRETERFASPRGRSGTPTPGWDARAPGSSRSWTSSSRSARLRS